MLGDGLLVVVVGLVEEVVDAALVIGPEGEEVVIGEILLRGADGLIVARLGLQIGVGGRPLVTRVL